jgi:hypothetical protein
MPDTTVSAERQSIAPLALSVVMHAETVSRVNVVDLRRDDQLVDLKFGDERNGVSLLGQAPDVLRLLERAVAKVRLAIEPGGSR